MTIEQARKLKIDENYIFVLKDGREVKGKGTWLAFTDNTGWKLNRKRIEMVDHVKTL